MKLELRPRSELTAMADSAFDAPTATTHTPTTSAEVAHPLTQAVFPRYTPQEAMILNILASAHPHFETVENILAKLRRTLQPSPWGGPTYFSLQVAISSIRAKLGEKRWHPSRIVSIHEMTPRGTRGPIVGYAWKG